jgi:hydroxypyruvate reductase
VKRPAAALRDDALRIWKAGVDAVRSPLLVESTVRVAGDRLYVGDTAIDLLRVRRIAVVGAGKAGAGMAQGLETALGPAILAAKHVTGWVNVPADCVRTLQCIQLHAARPAGVNEPTPEGVAGTECMLDLAASLGEEDVCFCLLSGGGSALAPAPVPEITLDDKQRLTRHLGAAGANIRELNTVRKQLSRFKGGGLLRTCRAGWLITLIISDVMGDPLDVIASGPTVADSSTPAEALAILERYGAQESGASPAVWDYLRRKAPPASRPTCRAVNLVIGNIAVAVDAAGAEADGLGYSAAMQAATELEGPAEDVGRHLAQVALAMRRHRGPNCLITGGEPIVRLAPPEIRGQGGRNQQLVLAALADLARHGLEGIALLSGGTDGEDGPTDAAGAFIDQDILDDALARHLDMVDHLRRNDAYHFFEQLGALIKTGPTHTNVCDLRVVVVGRAQAPPF